tara:strand:- start:91781 stop:92101 length:321 start_codon:yes stop_codon:yes gene_type:complete
MHRLQGTKWQHGESNTDHYCNHQGFEQSYHSGNLHRILGRPARCPHQASLLQCARKLRSTLKSELDFPALLILQYFALITHYQSSITLPYLQLLLELCPTLVTTLF